MLMREMPLVNAMAPGSIHFIFTKTLKIFAAIYLLLFYFTFIYLPLSDLILAIGVYKGIDNPLAFVGCKHLLRVCV